MSNERSPRQRRRERCAAVLGRLPGLGASALLAGAGTALGHLVPLVGAPVFGLLLGVVLGLVRRAGARLRPGIATASGSGLQLAVVLLGAQLSLPQVVRVGAGSLPVMVGTLAACLGLAALLGRWMRLGSSVTTLVGVGTGICGASAIAAVTPVVAADGAAVAAALSTIFASNIAAVLTFPALGHLLGMGQHAFGLFAGTAVNDTSSVVAAAGAYGPAATQHAVVVKLTRTLLLVPICLVLAWWRARSAPNSSGSRVPVRRFLPWFLVGFLLLAGLNSAGLLPEGSHRPLNACALFLITSALAGIGLSLDVPALRRTGPRPLLLGFALWTAVTATSLFLQALTHSG